MLGEDWRTFGLGDGDSMSGQCSAKSGGPVACAQKGRGEFILGLEEEQGR